MDCLQEQPGGPLEQEPGGLLGHEPKPLLNLLPVELKSKILKSIHSFRDHYALTTASKPFYVVAQHDNTFTNTALQELDSRGISLLPRGIIPPSLTYMNIIVRVTGNNVDPRCKRGEIGKAFKAYFTQYQEGAVRLQVRECRALLSMWDVVKWECATETEPGELARNVVDPKEHITIDFLAQRTNRYGQCVGPRWFIRINKFSDYHVARYSGHHHSFEGVDADISHKVVERCGWHT